MSSSVRKKSSNPTPEINLALVGELGSGKSEDTYVKQDLIGQQDITVHVMDTFDKPDSDPTRYLRWADAMLVVYSITDRVSFDRARDYCDIISQYSKSTGREIPIALVANKIDLELYREVSKDLGMQLAADFECVFYETTAAEDIEYVECVFRGIITEYLRERNILPLFISEDRTQTSVGGMLAPPQASSFSLLRAKSPKPVPGEKKDDKPVTRKTSASSFKLFNKSFKIFN